MLNDNGKLLNFLLDNWDKIAPVTFGYGNQIPKYNWPNASSEVKQYFLGRPGLKNITLTDLYSDSNFVYPARLAVLYHAKYSSIFPYVFEFTDGQFANLINVKLPEGFKEGSKII